jgi:hypothetical protein
VLGDRGCRIDREGEGEVKKAVFVLHDLAGAAEEAVEAIVER